MTKRNPATKKAQHREANRIGLASYFQMIVTFVLGLGFMYLYVSENRFYAAALVLFLMILFIFVAATDRTARTSSAQLGRTLMGSYGVSALFALPLFVNSFEGVIFLLAFSIMLGFILLVRYWDTLSLWWSTRG